MSSEDFKTLIQEAESEILSPRHSFDMVIPGEVRINPNLSWDEKIFYSLIRNLCRREGYCWATNDYLRKEMNVCERTIKNWVLSLVKENLIEREIIFYQMKKRRRIWLKALEFKKVIIGKMDSPPSGNAVPHGRESGCPYTEESITEENKSCLLSADAEDQKISSIEKERKISSDSSSVEKVTVTKTNGEKIIVSLQEVFKEAVMQRKDWKADEIHSAWRALCDYKGLVNDPLRYIEGTISNIRNKKKSEFLAKQKEMKACHKKENRLSIDSKENLSDPVSKKPRSQISILEQLTRMQSQNG